MLRIVIEKKRKLMISVAGKYGLDSEKTLKHSQELDKLLNLDHFIKSYKKIIKRKTNSLAFVLKTSFPSIVLKKMPK